MTRPQLAVTVAAAALATAVAGCSVAPNSNTLPGQVAVGSDGYTITAPFDNVQNLVPNSNVQYNNVTIGTVAKIEVSGWHAEVKLRLKKSIELPANVTLKIAQKSLLGAEYVQIDDPTELPAGRLAQGATLRMTQTGAYPETEQVLSAVSLLLNNGGLSQINTITTQLNAALGGREPEARAVVDKLDTLLSTLDRQKSHVIDALDAINGLTKKLAAQRDVVAGAIDRITPGLKALNEERVKLVRAIDAVGKFGTTATRVVNITQSSLLSNLANLRPILEQVNKAGNDLPKALNYLTTVPFPLQNVQRALKGDYANLFLTLDLSLSTLAGSFLGTTGKTVPASLQKGNPVTTPLTATPAKTPPESTTRPNPPKSGNAPTQPAPSAPPKSGSPTTTAPSCPLLTKLLGGC